MNKQEAEKVIAEYVKPIFGFALKRCKSQEDAEDLAQEIVLRAFKSLLMKEDILDVEKFIWTIAHNTLSNYYRSASKMAIGVSVDDVAETLADPRNNFDEDEDKEEIGRLQKEIAYLSKLQRQIVIAYYFENRKQVEIAEELQVPVGTVKWHLFEAKKELKRGMEKMREASELKFNPIKFDIYGFSGSMGTKSPDEFLRSAIAQNICYIVRKEAKSIHEIADALGVSPVFVEGEVEFLEEYGFLLQQKDKYIANFVIDEATSEGLTLQAEVYRQAAEPFANDLYDELIKSGILEDERIVCSKGDKNFLLWSLLPFAIAYSSEAQEVISFDEVATLRPDGGKNIYQAKVLPKDKKLTELYEAMKKWCGPMWNGTEELMLWQIDTPWSEREKPDERNVQEEHSKVLALYGYQQNNVLSQSDYAWLAERGYMKRNRNGNQDLQAEWQVVILQDEQIKKELIAIGKKIQEKYKEKFKQLKGACEEVILADTPKHLKKMRQYLGQYTLNCDGAFIWYCICVLLENGKLKLPTEEQRKSLTTILCSK